MDPYPTLDNTVYNQIVATSVLQFGDKGYFGSIDILKEESDTLVVKQHYYMRHQRPQNVSATLTTAATGRPMISNMAFDDSGVGMIVAYTYFFDSTADTRTLGFARIIQADPSSVDWIYYFNIN